jgi:hypothetical protein
MWYNIELDFRVLTQGIQQADNLKSLWTDIEYYKVQGSQ